MAYAFTEAGFDAFDVHMTDLQTGRANLADFAGVVACGGFSYGDTLGTALAGPARSPSTLCWLISSRPSLAEATPLVWACAMVARCLPSWLTSSPALRIGRASPPTRVSALRRASAWWRCWIFPSLFFAGMAGTRLPIAVAHGEGYADFRRRGDADQAIAAMRFSDNMGRPPRPIRSTPTAVPAA